MRSPGFAGGRSNRAGQESGGRTLTRTRLALLCVFPCLHRHLVAIQFFTYAWIYFPFGRIKNRPFALRRITGHGNLGPAGVNRAYGASYQETARPSSVFFLLPSRATGSPAERVSRAMSIDTLLEAARYLEWQAQQQQITRGESKSRLVHGAEPT